jgi:hypothetical protein
MAKTRHIQQQMNRRSINDRMLYMIEQFGVNNGDKIILNRKACQSIESELRRLLSDITKLQGRGGAVLVSAGGDLITTYTLDSYRRGKQHH